MQKSSRYQVSSTREDPERCNLDHIVDAFEANWTDDPPMPLEAFLPARTAPDYEDVAIELLCVDMERRSRRGGRFDVSFYQQTYPQILAAGNVLSRFAYAEFKLRRCQGHDAVAEEYAEQLGVDTSDWGSTIGVPGAEADTVTRDAFSIGILREMERIASVPIQLPREGDKFGNFEIIERLATCSFGAVYLARQDLGQRPVVLKVSTSLDLLVESDRLAMLRHPNIVPLHSIHQQDGLQVACMPFLGRLTLKNVLECMTGAQSGQSVSALLRSQTSSSDFCLAERGGGSTESRSSQRGSGAAMPSRGYSNESRNADADAKPGESSAPKDVDLDVDTVPRHERRAHLDYLSRLDREHFSAWSIAKVADGLAHAHQHGILHRDLKPGNILFTDDGEPMILDFNLSENILTDGQASQLVGGTLPYMAPEQLAQVLFSPNEGLDDVSRSLMGRRIDARSDIYSLGVMLFELLTGTLPFPVRRRACDDAGIMLSARLRPADSVRQRSPRLSRSIESIVQRCLALDPAARYATAIELRDDLLRHLADRPMVHAPNPSIRERLGKRLRRHRRSITLGTAAAMLLLVSAGVVTWQHRAKGELERLSAMRDHVAAWQAAKFDLALPGVSSEQLNQAADSARAALALHEKYAEHWLRSDRSELPESIAAFWDRIVSPAEIYCLLADIDCRKANLLNLEQSNATLRKTLGQLTMALDHCDESTRRAIYEQLRRVHSLIGDIEQAHIAGLQAKREPAGAASNFLEIQELIEQKKFQEAIEQLKRLDLDGRGDYVSYFQKGYCYARLREYNAAIQCFSDCIEHEPRALHAYHHRGKAWMQLAKSTMPGDTRGECFANAEADFTAVLDKREFPEVFLNRGKARHRQKSYDLAVQDFTRAIETGRDDVLPYVLRRESYLALGKERQAAEDWARATNRDPIDEDGWLERAAAFRSLGEWEKALADYRGVLELKPGQAKAVYNSLSILDGLQRYGEALDLATKTLEAVPDAPLLLAYRALILAKLDDHVAAHRDLEAALALQPNENVIFAVACALAETSRHNEADAELAVRKLAEAVRGNRKLVRQVSNNLSLKLLDHRQDYQELLKAWNLAL